jgi:lipid A 4'-phosphatase
MNPDVPAADPAAHPAPPHPALIGIAAYGGLVAASLALFLLVPGLDIATSRLFYDPHRGFVGNDWEGVRLLVGAVPWIAWAILVVVILGALFLFLVERPLWRLDRRGLVFIFASTLIGPGLLVNSVLKAHWGRARPYQTQLFGGTHLFTPAGEIAHQCLRNCSFVSGHAALGFGLVAFALLLAPGRRRVVAQAAALAFGALVGFGRIAEGGHFLSDVVDAGLLVYGVSWVLYAAIVERDLLARPAAMRLYRAAGRGLAALWARPWGYLVVWAAAVAIVEALSMIFVDDKLARALHVEDPGLHELFATITWFGLGYPPLVLCAVLFVLLRWGGRLPRLRAYAGRMREGARVPLFVFTAVAAAGIGADLIKIVCGRTRPKLLFAHGIDAFTGFSLRPDHWSFPSGHTATIAAFATALWCVWPRHVLFYILLVAIVALSRLVLDQHYLSDTIMGAVVAVLATRGSALLFLPRTVPRQHSWPEGMLARGRRWPGRGADV